MSDFCQAAVYLLYLEVMQIMAASYFSLSVI